MRRLLLIRFAALILIRDILIPGSGVYLAISLLKSGDMQPWHIPMLIGMMGTPLVGRGSEEPPPPDGGPPPQVDPIATVTDLLLAEVEAAAAAQEAPRELSPGDSPPSTPGAEASPSSPGS